MLYIIVRTDPEEKHAEEMADEGKKKPIFVKEKTKWSFISKMTKTDLVKDQCYYVTERT